jgi:hypothetical protein
MVLLQAQFSNNQYTTDKTSLLEYNTRFTVMVSDPATGRTVTGFSMQVLLATPMGINKISLDFVFSSRNIDMYFRDVQGHATCIKWELFLTT